MYSQLEEPWRYTTDDEARMAAESARMLETQPATSTTDFSYRSSEHDYLKHGWPDEDRITRILDDSQEDLPHSEDEAIRLISQRFGSVYGKLSDELRSNVNVLFAATVESGHNLGRAPEKVQEALTPEFFIEAMQAGARAWILQWAPENVRRNQDVQLLAITEHPYNEKFILDPGREVTALIQQRRASLAQQVNGDRPREDE